MIRRAPERALLHSVMRQHLETFLDEVRLRGDGAGLPWFVERELREFVTCGTMARGFARFRCGGCRREILVAFSCKGRGFCPSCCGRRMCELAAHLVDGVFEDVPVRQWVLTPPYRLRYRAEHALPPTDAPVFWVGLVYFATWTVTIATGLALADTRRATGLGILATGALFAVAAPVHWLATGDHLLRSAGRDDWYVAGTDLTLLAVAAVAIACAVRILSPRAVAATAEHRSVAGDTALTAERRPIAAE